MAATDDDPSDLDAGGVDGASVLASEFVDGYLAAMATLSATLAEAEADTHFYSFDWVGPLDDPADGQLLAAFQSDAGRMRIDLAPVADWRTDVGRLARKWLGRDLAPAAANALVVEFQEILEAFLGGPGDVAAFRVDVSPPDGRDVYEPRIGASFDHLMFETAEGRFLLEFVVDDS